MRNETTIETKDDQNQISISKKINFEFLLFCNAALVLRCGVTLNICLLFDFIYRCSFSISTILLPIKICIVGFTPFIIHSYNLILKWR